MSLCSIITASIYLKQFIFKPHILRCARPCVDFVRLLASSKVELPKPPKKSPGRFFLFFQDKRLQIVAENPGKKQTELSKIAAAMWKTLDEEEKKFYDVEDQKRRQEYAAEYEVYMGSLTEKQRIQLEEENHRKKLSRIKRRQKIEEKELNKPKRPGTGYSMFVKEWYAKNAQSDSVKGGVSKISKVTAELWNTLPTEEKTEYTNKAAELMREYTEDLKKWYQKMEAQGRLDLVRSKPKEVRWGEKRRVGQTGSKKSEEKV